MTRNKKMAALFCSLAIMGLTACETAQHKEGDRTTTTIRTKDMDGDGRHVASTTFRTKDNDRVEALGRDLDRDDTHATIADGYPLNQRYSSNYNQDITYNRDTRDARSVNDSRYTGYNSYVDGRDYKNNYVVTQPADARYTDSRYTRDTRYTSDRPVYRDTTAVAAPVRAHAYDRSEVITFTPGSAVLSDAQKTKIRNLVNTVGEDKVDRIELAAWSDKEFPNSATDLSKADRKLADDRIANINRFLKNDLDVSGMRISTYNMAEGSNWLARTFRTDDAELKSVFSKDSSDQMGREEFNLIRREGSHNKAVLVLIPKK